LTRAAPRRSIRESGARSFSGRFALPGSGATVVLLVILAADSAAYQSIFLWSLALIGLLLVGFFVVMKVKARLKEPDQPVSIGFSLSDLRKLHESGQLSDEEYEKARTRLVAAMQKAEQPAAAKRDAGGTAPSSDEWVERARARRKQRDEQQKTGEDEPDDGAADM
jgi:hypothetical protein